MLKSKIIRLVCDRVDSSFLRLSVACGRFSSLYEAGNSNLRHTARGQKELLGDIKVNIFCRIPACSDEISSCFHDTSS